MPKECLRNIFAKELKERLKHDTVTQRELAVNHNWDEHIKFVKDMLPILVFLGDQDVFMSRLLGRLAWSYIRKGDTEMASSLLKCSEEYDLWQAAANYFWYFWAHEHSCSQKNIDKYAEECLKNFIETVKKLHVFAESELHTSDYLKLGVKFYEKLDEHGKQSHFYTDKSPQSDRGRFLELRARLNQDTSDYVEAEKVYNKVGLQNYAACCRIFRLRLEIVRQDDFVKKNEKLDDASNVLEKKIFADETIQDLYKKFIDLRKAFCKLYIMLGDNSVVAGDIQKQLEHISEIYNSNDSKCFYELAIENRSFSNSSAYAEFKLIMADLLDGKINFYDIEEIRKIDTSLNEVHDQLPSYTL